MLTASANRCIVPKVMRVLGALVGGFWLGVVFRVWRDLIAQERLAKAATSTLSDDEYLRLRYYVGLIKSDDGN